MTRENFTETITELRQRQPFDVFTVELLTGEQLEIVHPEALMIVPQAGKAVYADADGRLRIFDHRGVTQILEGGTHAFRE